MINTDLAYTPTHIIDVTPPKGINIRTGTVNPGNFGGKGGATQFEILGDNIDNVNFTNPRPIRQN